MKTYQYFTLLSVILSAVCFGSIVDIDRRGEAYLLFGAFAMSALACIVAFLQRKEKIR